MVFVAFAHKSHLYICENKSMKKLLTIFICLSFTVSAQRWKDLEKLSKKAKSELKKNNED